MYFNLGTTAYKVYFSEMLTFIFHSLCKIFPYELCNITTKLVLKIDILKHVFSIRTMDKS